jgi:hypothetical protein
MASVALGAAGVYHPPLPHADKITGFSHWLGGVLAGTNQRLPRPASSVLAPVFCFFVPPSGRLRLRRGRQLLP